MWEDPIYRDAGWRFLLICCPHERKLCGAMPDGVCWAHDLRVLFWEARGKNRLGTEPHDQVDS